MRVLLLSIGHFVDAPGGVQRFVEDEASALRDRGHEAWVLAPGPASLPEHEIRDGVHLLRYVPAKVAAWNPARMSGHQAAVRRLLARYLPSVDALHGHVPLPYLAALDFYGESVHAAYDVHSPARMEMAIVWRNAALLRKMTAPAGLVAINAIERACLRRSRVISVKSQFTADCLAKVHGGKLAASARVLSGWADASRYMPLQNREQAKEKLGWPVGVPVLFTLRRLRPRMGLMELLDAARILHVEGMSFHLIIGGDGPLRPALEQQAESLGLKGKVGFLGRVADEILPLAYGACDAFVLPTAELECFGIIAVEALLAGRPVLATPVGAIPEIMAKIEPQWLARSANPRDIAALLRRYLCGELPAHNPDELHRQAEQAYGHQTVLPAYLEHMLGAKQSATGAAV